MASHLGTIPRNENNELRLGNPSHNSPCPYYHCQDNTLGASSSCLAVYATGPNCAGPAPIPRMIRPCIILGRMFDPESPLDPPHAVTEVGTKGHKDDSSPTVDFLEKSAWTTVICAQPAGSPFLRQTEGPMPVDQIPEDC